MLSPAGQGSSEPLTQDFSYEEKVAFERLKFNKGLNSQQAYEVIIAARGAAPPAAVTDTPSGGISLGPPPAVGPAADEAPVIDPLDKVAYAPLPAAPSAPLGLPDYRPAGEGDYSRIDKAAGTRNRPGHSGSAPTDPSALMALMAQPPAGEGDDPLLVEPAEPAAKGVVSDPLGDHPSDRDMIAAAREGGQDLDSSTLLSLLDQARSALPGQQQVTTGDRLLQALEILGGIGGGIATDRAPRRADKETARRQSVANLINTLRGRPTAKAAPATPKLGVGGRLLQGVGAIGKSGAALRDIERGGKQQAYENLLSLVGRGTDVVKAETDHLKALRGDGDGQGQITDAGIRDALEGLGVGLFMENSEMSKEELGARAIEELNNIGVDAKYHNLYAGKIYEGFNGALTGRIKTDQAGDRLGVSRDRLRHSTARTETKRIEDIATNLGESVYAKVYKNALLSKKAVSPVETYLDMFNSFKDMADIEDVPKRYKSMVLNEMTKKYDEAMTQAYKDLRKEGGLPDTARMAQAEIRALGEKIDHLEELRGGVEVDGVLARFVPDLQLLFPNSYAYDHIHGAFALEVASVLNRGRPSDKDMIAAEKLIPSRDDTAEVARAKFAILRKMMLSAADSIDKGWPAPVSIFDTGETEEIDGVSIPVYDFTHTEGSNRRLLETWREWVKTGDELQRREGQEMLEKWGEKMEEFGGASVTDEDISPDEEAGWAEAAEAAEEEAQDQGAQVRHDSN